MKKQVYQKPTIEMEGIDNEPLMIVASVKTNLEGLENGNTSGNQEDAWSRNDSWGGAWQE